MFIADFFMFLTLTFYEFILILFLTVYYLEKKSNVNRSKDAKKLQLAVSVGDNYSLNEGSELSNNDSSLGIDIRYLVSSLLRDIMQELRRRDIQVDCDHIVSTALSDTEFLECTRNRFNSVRLAFYSTNKKSRSISDCDDYASDQNDDMHDDFTNPDTGNRNEVAEITNANNTRHNFSDSNPFHGYNDMDGREGYSFRINTQIGAIEATQGTAVDHQSIVIGSVDPNDISLSADLIVENSEYLTVTSVAEEVDPPAEGQHPLFDYSALDALVSELNDLMLSIVEGDSDGDNNNDNTAFKCSLDSSAYGAGRTTDHSLRSYSKYVNGGHHECSTSNVKGGSVEEECSGAMGRKILRYLFSRRLKNTTADQSTTTKYMNRAKKRLDVENGYATVDPAPTIPNPRVLAKDSETVEDNLELSSSSMIPQGAQGNDTASASDCKSEGSSQIEVDEHDDREEGDEGGKNEDSVLDEDRDSDRSAFEREGETEKEKCPQGEGEGCYDSLGGASRAVGVGDGGPLPPTIPALSAEVGIVEEERNSLGQGRPWDLQSGMAGGVGAKFGPGVSGWSSGGGGESRDSRNLQPILMGGREQDVEALSSVCAAGASTNLTSAPPALATATAADVMSIIGDIDEALSDADVPDALEDDEEGQDGVEDPSLVVVGASPPSIVAQGLGSEAHSEPPSWEPNNAGGNDIESLARGLLFSLSTETATGTEAQGDQTGVPQRLQICSVSHLLPPRMALFMPPTSGIRNPSATVTNLEADQPMVEGSLRISSPPSSSTSVAPSVQSVGGTASVHSGAHTPNRSPLGASHTQVVRQAVARLSFLNQNHASAASPSSPFAIAQEPWKAPRDTSVISNADIASSRMGPTTLVSSASSFSNSQSNKTVPSSSVTFLSHGTAGDSLLLSSKPTVLKAESPQGEGSAASQANEEVRYTSSEQAIEEVEEEEREGAGAGRSRRGGVSLTLPTSALPSPSASPVSTPRGRFSVSYFLSDSAAAGGVTSSDSSLALPDADGRFDILSSPGHRSGMPGTGTTLDSPQMEEASDEEDVWLALAADADSALAADVDDENYWEHLRFKMQAAAERERRKHNR